MNVKHAFRYMRDTSDFRLPYGVIPGSGLGTTNYNFADEQAWNGYQWNPPQNLRDVVGFTEADPDASAKPTWAVVVAADSVATTMEVRRERLQALLNEVLRQERQRICAAYIGNQNGSQTVTQELLFRARSQESGLDISAKHTERDRLHAKAVALKAWVEHADRTLTELESFNPTADGHWAEPEDEEGTT